MVDTGLQSPDNTLSVEHTMRAMVVADIIEVMRVENACYQLPWSEQIIRDCLKVGYFSLVLEAESGLAGYVIFSGAAGESHILNLCVDPQYRRSGYAEALLHQAIATAMVHGAKVMFLEVRESNVAAIALYEKAGFVETGRRENYYNTASKKEKTSKREDALVMAKELCV